MNQLIHTTIHPGSGKFQGWFSSQSGLSPKKANRFLQLLYRLHFPLQKKGKTRPEKYDMALTTCKNYQPDAYLNDFSTAGHPHQEMICIETKLEEAISMVQTASDRNANRFKIVTKERHNISVNKKALGIILKNLFTYINEQNQAQHVNLNVLEDNDYTVIVAEHGGRPLSRTELKQVYQSAPSLIADITSALLYSCLHILRATGGWLTAGERKAGVNYISLGLPKI